uniref:Uncharacterized protein n=1 Tax=Octopus bimaculoides TaxID=37653 RepID=A0A0L8G1U6_OCTBM
MDGFSCRELQMSVQQNEALSCSMDTNASLEALQTFWQMEQVEDLVCLSAWGLFTLCFLERLARPALLRATKPQ